MGFQLDGRSEEAIGLKGLAEEFTITTKAPTGTTPGNGSYEIILKEARLSFAALKVDRVRVFLGHQHALNFRIYTLLTGTLYIGGRVSPPRP